MHQQQQMQFQQFQQQQSGKQMTALYQPSESDFSFDLAATAAAGGGPVDLRNVSAQHRTNVQRSISQPECTNEGDKSLLK